MEKQKVKQTQLRSKEFNEMIANYPIQFSKKDNIERVEGEGFTLILVNKLPSFFYCGEKVMPTLKFLQQQQILPQIVVDMGAIPFVIKGADIMRPGIVQIDANVQKDKPVVVIDQTHRRPLAVGISLFNAAEMQGMATGKVVKNIHYVGDTVWNFGGKS